MLKMAAWMKAEGADVEVVYFIGDGGIARQ